MRGTRGAVWTISVLVALFATASAAWATEYEEKPPIGGGAGYASAVTVDQSTGNVYVAELLDASFGEGYIARFDSDGDPLSPATMGASSYGGVAVDPNAPHDVYGLTTHAFAFGTPNNLVGFNAAGGALGAPFPFSSTRTGALQIAVSPSGAILVPSEATNSILEFDPATGAQIGEITCSACPTGFASLHAVAVDSAGNVFVASRGAESAGSERQKLDVSATDGTFTLTFEGQTTDPIAFDASDSAVREALEELSTIGSGNIAVQNFLGDRILVFQGALSGMNLPLITADSSGLTGGAAVVTAYSSPGAGPPRVVKFGPLGDADPTPPAVFGPEPALGQEEILSVAVNPANGNVFIARTGGGVHITEYDPAGNEISNFGSGSIEAGLNQMHLAVDGNTGTVYVADVTAAQDNGFVRVFTPIPAPTAETEPASAIGQDAATLNGTVNPNGKLTEDCHFEWGPAEGEYNLGSAPCDPDPFNEADPVAVSAEVGGLSPQTTYHYRVVIETEAGEAEGEDVEFTTAAPQPTATTEAATGISQTVATLNGKVDAEGSATTACEFKYGTTTAYGKTAPCDPASVSGTTPTAVKAALSGLSAGTTYHYRLVTANAGGEAQGSDMTFTTAADTCETNVALCPPPPPSDGGGSTPPPPPSDQGTPPPTAKKKPLKCKKGFKKKKVKGKQKCVKVKKKAKKKKSKR